MIPTRDEIRTCDNSGFASEKVVKWLHDMRGEIEHLTFKSDKAEGALRGAGWTQSPVSCEWKPPIGPNPSPLLEQIERLKAELGEANSARNSWKVGSEVLIADRDRCRTDLKAANETIAVLRKDLDLSESVSGQLQADLDRANTEAALARDAMAKATTDTCAKVQNELRSVERALCSADVLIKYAAWSRGAYECHVKNTIETAIDALRDDSATTPYSPPFEGDPKDCAFKASDPVREEEIKAWRDWALGDIADPDLYDDCFVLSRAEIDSAVALMRSAGDPDAKLRELRAWMVDKAGMHLREGFGWFLDSALERIDEMLAQPAPSHVYSRGRTIAESAEPPTAYYPPAPVEIWPEEMKRQTLVGKFEPAPVEQPAAAVPDHFPDAGKMVPDDTRELVAQLADVAAEFFVAPWGDRAKAIAKQLRGGA